MNQKYKAIYEKYKDERGYISKENIKKINATLISKVKVNGSYEFILVLTMQDGEELILAGDSASTHGIFYANSYEGGINIEDIKVTEIRKQKVFLNPIKY